jgi:predicted transcriptional regulator
MWETESSPRTAVGLCSSDLAGRANVEETRITKEEAGTFSLSTLAKINNALSSNLDYLAFGEGPPFREDSLT